MSYPTTGTTLIDFWSPQCGPCRQLSPIIDEIEKEFTNVNVVKIDTTKDVEEAIKFGVRSLPTLIFLQDGEVMNKMVGLQSKEAIEVALEELI